MMFDTSVIFQANYRNQSHVIVNQGGTSSGKTYSILQTLFCYACEEPKQVITIAGQDIPNLKAGALRDALNIYNGSTLLKTFVKSFNKSDRRFEFNNGTIMEFNSYDNAQDAKSGKRNYLFINEANGIPFDVYNELALRTNKQIYIDYNPNSEFWVHDNIIGKPNVELIISDHRHNPFLSELTRQKIEALKDIDRQLWEVYARGKTGKIQGLVLTNWFLCDGIPEFAKLIAHGLDFGFTNDETGFVSVYLQNGELWVQESIYETGLTNSDISKKLTENSISKNVEIIADSAEPKSIEELRRLGWNIKDALKGPDSIKNGIDILKRYKINVTRGSVNLRMELSRYKWKVDKATGKTLNIPIETFNHLIDPLRYVALNKLKINHSGKAGSKLPWRGDNHFVSDYDKIR
jgi:phage terminase large subunit